MVFVSFEPLEKNNFNFINSKSIGGQFSQLPSAQLSCFLPSHFTNIYLVISPRQCRAYTISVQKYIWFFFDSFCYDGRGTPNLSGFLMYIWSSREQSYFILVLHRWSLEIGFAISLLWEGYFGKFFLALLRLLKKDEKNILTIARPGGLFLGEVRWSFFFLLLFLRILRCIACCFN